MHYYRHTRYEQHTPQQRPYGDYARHMECLNTPRTYVTVWDYSHKALPISGAPYTRNPRLHASPWEPPFHTLEIRV
jgi:hypothetical protein